MAGGSTAFKVFHCKPLFGIYRGGITPRVFRWCLRGFSQPSTGMAGMSFGPGGLPHRRVAQVQGGRGRHRLAERASERAAGASATRGEKHASPGQSKRQTNHTTSILGGGSPYFVFFVPFSGRWAVSCSWHPIAGLSLFHGTPKIVVFPFCFSSIPPIKDWDTDSKRNEPPICIARNIVSRPGMFSGKQHNCLDFLGAVHAGSE